MRKDPFEEIENVASATECTGLLPALPVDEPEAEADVARLYAIHAPEPRQKKPRRRRKNCGTDRQNGF